MNTTTDKQKYTILKRETIACRIIDIEKRTSLYGKDAEYFIVKIGEYDSGKYIYNNRIPINDFGKQYNELYTAMKNRTQYLMQKLLIKPTIKVYHVWTWDDYFLKRCKNYQVGEIERDKNDYPRIYEEFVYYTKEGTQINEQKIDWEINEGGYIKNYIPVNAPDIQNKLAYKNQAHKIKTGNYTQDEIYNYNDYEESHEDIDRTPEDTIMSALENGNGDCFGF